MLAGEGTVCLSGRPLEAWSARDLARCRAYLAQQQPAVSMMPVFQYLRLHQPPLADEAVIEGAVDFLAARLMLADKLPRSLTRLSGGEWQRVRLAAALLQIWPQANPTAACCCWMNPATAWMWRSRLRWTICCGCFAGRD